MILLHFFNVIY